MTERVMGSLAGDARLAIRRLRRSAGFTAAAGAVTTLPMNPVGIDYALPFSA